MDEAAASTPPRTLVALGTSLDRAERGLSHRPWTTAESDHAGLHHFANAVRLQHLEHGLELRRRASDLDAERLRTHIDYLRMNSSAVSMTPCRVCSSARTFTRSSSRCTAWFSSSSTIFSTLTSLFSCFVTCSRALPSTPTTIVMRDSPGCSVGPTASDSMLNPRRLNSPATRASTPGLFSTRTDRVCLVIAHPSLSKTGRMPRAAMMSSLLVPAATIGQTIASLPTVKSTTTG